jgi:hemicentin
VWQKDGVPLNVRSSEDNQVLLISEERTTKSRYTCVATNKAGTISRDFFVQFIAPPKLADQQEELVTEVMEGHTITLECPIDSPLESVDIEWFINGRPIRVLIKNNILI